MQTPGWWNFVKRHFLKVVTHKSFLRTLGIFSKYMKAIITHGHVALFHLTFHALFTSHNTHQLASSEFLGTGS
jgi:hypothetical protein